jgi:hypothetical protein
VLILVSYIGLVLFSISTNKEALQKDTYWDWYRNYVGQSTKGAYVNTGSKEKPIALSESRIWHVDYATSTQKGMQKKRNLWLFYYYKSFQIMKKIR